MKVLCFWWEFSHIQYIHIIVFLLCQLCKVLGVVDPRLLYYFILNICDLLAQPSSPESEKPLASLNHMLCTKSYFFVLYLNPVRWSWTVFCYIIEVVPSYNVGKLFVLYGPIYIECILTCHNIYPSIMQSECNTIEWEDYFSYLPS